MNQDISGSAKIDIPGVLNGDIELQPNLKKVKLCCKYLDFSSVETNSFKKKHFFLKHDKKKLQKIELDLNIKTLKLEKILQLEGIRGSVNWRQPSIPFYAMGLDEYHWLKSEIRCLIRSKKAVSSVHFFTVPKKNHTDIRLVFKGLSGIFQLLGVNIIANTGGAGEYSGTQAADGAYQGIIVCRDVVTQGLWMAKILSLLSPSALTELLHSSLDFSEIFVQCFYKKGVLTLKKGSAKGFNLGAFLKGEINFRTQALFLKGGVVPAYFFNTFFSHIPIIGDLLGQEKGIISGQFFISGSLTNPKFFVNPFSIFELGGLKMLFDRE
ncbi:hypothetical protein P618_200952 [Holospora obtusa F1]|uniref:Uncharacterized protein n=1 Tax=Holospora obtusa F1 TaxID=1399147 RepID=W6TDP6_HOLOB|nr:AsmA-like C-terminal domain-containing protein [Holospora obtusa]ETZ06881.1 hypothetical protein P618_200952 [Holospora obtusa F1]